MKYKIQIPGKTFFFGEYAALVGGSALLLTTRPGFEMNVHESIHSTSNPFHPESPAGLYFNQHEKFFQNWSIAFVDHYQGRGGFGASTAQFLGLALFRKQIQTPNEFNDLDVAFKSIDGLATTGWQRFCGIV